jgi:hypothetical protein
MRKLRPPRGNELRKSTPRDFSTKGADMRHRKLGAILVGCLLIGFVTVSGGTALGGSGAAAVGMDELLAIGKVAPTPIELKVSIQGPKGTYPKSGEESTITFRTKKKAYVMVLGTSGKVSVDILFPNRSHPKALVSPDADYTLAGGRSGILAFSSKKPEAAWIVFYVSSQPVVLPGGQIPFGKGWLSILSKDSSRIKELADTIRSMSEAPGFNRIALPLRLKLVDCFAESCKKGRGRPKGFRLMGRPPDSESPIGVTGGQGRAGSTKRKHLGQ